MKTPFKVGDRVAVYSGRGRFVGTVETVMNTILEVRLDGRVGQFHSHQCRRLVKKPRRRVWIAESNLVDSINSGLGVPAYRTRPGFSDQIEFVEVRRKKKV